jgi:hypothetical protein
VRLIIVALPGLTASGANELGAGVPSWNTRIYREKSLSVSPPSRNQRTYVSALERGVYGATIDMVEKLAAVLGAEPSSLLQRSVKTRIQKS